MSQVIDNAVGELIKRQQGTVSYTDNGKEVVVTSKPAHYSVHVQLIDKEARKRKQSSVRLDKTYTYPKEIEQAVLWDMLIEMRKAIIAHTGEQGCKSWDDTFGVSWPQLLIAKPKPTKVEQPKIPELKQGRWVNKATGEIYKYRGEERFGTVKVKTLKGSSAFAVLAENVEEL